MSLNIFGYQLRMLRFSLRTLVPNLVRRSSQMTAPIKPNNNISEELTEKKSKGSIVAAVFASLKDETDSIKENTVQNADNLTEKIINAKTINGLLGVTEKQGNLSRNHALKIVSILAEWSSINRVKLSEFESDPRFIKICKILGRTVSQKNVDTNQSTNNKRVSGFRTDDLNMVLGVTGDDEAAKLIASISPSQMVKVMSTLAQRKKRSTPLLRSVAYNLSSCSEQLDLKQCADVLFAISSLNFPDSVLIAKICSDIQISISKNLDKSAVVGSILRSLGLLRYRDVDVLECLSSWIINHNDVVRVQDYSALLLSLAILNYKSSDPGKIKKLCDQLNKEDFPKPFDWLNHVWTVTLLRFADENLIKSVLSKDFITELKNESSGLTPNLKMKLLNINAYAKFLVQSYNGPLIEDSEVCDVPITHNKSKQILVNGMLDALKSLSSKNSSRSLIDSKMGFLIDAVCCFDSNRNPKNIEENHPGLIKVAIMMVDFHDLCQGPNKSINGILNLSSDLLEKSNYKTLLVPFNEFSTSDKVIKRVQYLDAKFKEIVVNKN